MTFYTFPVKAEETNYEKLIRMLSSGNVKEAIYSYLYFDGPRLWVLFAAMIIAVGTVKLASEIAKEFGGAQLGGGVGNTGLAITAGAAGFVAGKVAPAVGKGIKKLGNKMSQDSSSSAAASTPSAGAKDYDGKDAQTADQKQNSAQTDNTNAVPENQSTGETPPATTAGGESATSANGEGGGDGSTEDVAAAATGAIVGAVAASAKKAAKETASVATGVGKGVAQGVTDGVSGSDSEGIDIPSAEDIASKKVPEMPGRGSGNTLTVSDSVKNDLRDALSSSSIDNQIEQKVSPVRQTADTALDEARKKNT